MTVYIFFASGQVDVSVIDRCCAPGPIDLIGYSRNAKDAVFQVIENKPQVVVIDSRNATDAAIKVMRELWNLDLVVIII